MYRKAKHKPNKQLHFSIRKLRFGVVSVAIASFYLLMGGGNVSANEIQPTTIEDVENNSSPANPPSPPDQSKPTTMAVPKENTLPIEATQPTENTLLSKKEDHILDKTKLSALIDEIDSKIERGVYQSKTEESLNRLKLILEDSRKLLSSAINQDQLTRSYYRLLTATTRLKSKPSGKVITPYSDDTTNGKPTLGKKADNTEKKSDSNSIENTGSHDPRNRQAMDTDNPFRTGEQPASEPIVDESYNSFVFSENDKDFKNHSKLEWFSKEGDGNNRNNASLKYGEDEDGKYMEWKSSQSRGGGFKLTIDKELGEEYTIGVKFSFDQTNGSWKKIIDYKNSESDNGFYFYSGGHLQFYPNGTISKNAVSNKEVVNFIIVKSKTEFAVYFVKKDGNITKEFSLTDTTTLSNAIPYTNNGKTILGFFFDDMRTGSEATPGGKIYSLSIYDKAIEPSKVVEKLNKKLDRDTHQPELKSPLPDVEKGSNPNAEDFIKNIPSSNETNKLPANTTIKWKTGNEPNTSTVGEKPSKILVTYPDGSTDEVDVNVNVVNRDFTPSKPPKTPVGDINNLTTDEVNKIKKAVEDANAGKTVTVDETGKATVTDPTTNISHEIPASDLKVQDFTPSKPPKTPVGDINNLTTDEVNKIKKAVEGVNAGKTVTVDETGKATVTDPTTNISHEIPASDLKVQDFTPSKPPKTPVGDVNNLTTDEVNKIKKAVEDANAGKTVTVDETGKATVTDPTTNISHEIPASDLKVQDFTPSKPPKTPVGDINNLTTDEVNKIKKAVEDANAGKTVTVDETGKATVTDPTTNISHEIPASDLKVQDFTPSKPPKTPVGDINNLTTDEVNKIKKAVEDANAGKTVTVDETGKATVTDPTTNISHEIPASDLKVQDFTPSKPPKTPVGDINNLTTDEVNKIKKAVEGVNAGKTVTVDETGKATVTDPTTNISHEIPASDLKVQDFTPSKPPKTPVGDVNNLTTDEVNKIKKAVEDANAGKTVTVDETGKATVTDPTTNISHEIPASDLKVQDFTPSKPPKTPVGDINNLTTDEVNKIKKAVEDANAGKTVTVDETGKATVTDPTTNISHEIPASDLKVQDFTPSKPPKTPVGDINNLTTDEVNKIKKAVEDANAGKTVTVDETGKATVTDPTTNISHEIPASDLKVQDFTPSKPPKTPVGDINNLTTDEVNKIKKAVEGVNAGKTVTVDETGKATVTDPTTNISHEIPASDLKVQDFTPSKPPKTPVGDVNNLTTDEVNKIKKAVEDANAGKTVTVDETGKATVTDPTTNISHEIPASDLKVQDFTPSKPPKTPVGDINNLTTDEVNKIKKAVEDANAGKTVTVDETGKATVTDPTTNISHEIPASDLKVQDFTPSKPPKTPVGDINNLTTDEVNKIKKAVEGVNAGKTVTVDETGKATVTDPTTNISHEIPASDLKVQDFTPSKPPKTPVGDVNNLTTDEVNKIKKAVEDANAGKTVTVDETGKATVTDPTTNISHEIPASDLKVQDFTPSKPPKTPVGDINNLTTDEVNKIKKAVEDANAGKTVTVDETGKATVTDPTTNISHEIPASDLKVQDFTPSKPPKTPVGDINNLTTDEVNKIKKAVEDANAGKTVTVDETGKATVTDPTTNISHEIPASDLKVQDFTPSKPPKTPVGDINNLTTDEVNKIKKAVEGVNAGKTVTVDETGKATVTDPTTNISHEIPASDLKVQDFTPSKPPKTPVGDVNNLTTDEVNKIKKAVEDANAGKTVTVDETGKATVTDPTTNISHEIPASDLKVQDFTPSKPPKTPVGDINNLTTDEVNKIKKAVEDANAGKTVTVDETGKATVTDPTTNISHEIPASDLKVQDFTPSKPPKTPVGDINNLTTDEVNKIKKAVEDANAGKTVTVDETGKATVTDPTTNISHEIPASDLKVQDFTPSKPPKTPVGDINNLTTDEVNKIKKAVEGVNAGKTVTVDETGKATVTDPTTNISHEIPASDLKVQDFTPSKPPKTPVGDVNNLTTDEVNKIKKAVEDANAGKTVTVDETGKATVTDPTTNISHEIPASDLKVQDFTPSKPPKTPVGDINNLTTDEVNKIKKAVEDANAGKTVTVDETGKATVTDPTTNISHEIPASDLKVQDFTPSKPPKTPVGDINNLTTDEVNKIKKAVEDANAGKTVSVDETGKATVTDPTTNISHEIPASDLKVQDFTPSKPPKTPVGDVNHLTTDEVNKIKKAVEGVNAGKTVTVDETGKATVTDTTTNISHEIPAEDLTTILPPKVDLPEFNGGVNGELPDPVQSPKINLIITKWVDEAGNDLKPADAKAPTVLGGPNEAFEHGTISGYVFLRTEEYKENNIVKHIFKAISSSRPNTQTDNEDKDSNGDKNNIGDVTTPGKTPREDNNQGQKNKHIIDNPIKQTKKKNSKNLLAKTGTKVSNTDLSIGGLSIFVGLGLALSKKKKEDENC